MASRSPAAPHDHLLGVIRLALALALLLQSFAALAEEATVDPSDLGEASVLSLGALEYRPGRGLRVGDSGFVLGGFANVKAEWAEESGGEFAVDAVDFFVIFDRFDRFRAVADLEVKDIFTADEETSGTQDIAFNVRRLFADFTIEDRLSVRAGTFLTPIGYWNLILAPPLTATTEAPLIIEEGFFEPTTTGVMLHGSTSLSRGRLDYSLFSQFLEPLEDDSDLEPPDLSVGVRLNYELLPGLSLGASYQSAEIGDCWSHLGGLHSQWQRDRVELLTEWYYQDGDALDSSQWGGYLQGTFEVVSPFYLVGRYEHFAPEEQPSVNSFTFGGLWRPLPFMAVKVEYRLADETFDDEDLDGFYASFSTFF